MKPVFFASSRCCLVVAAVLTLGLTQQAASQAVHAWGSNAYGQSAAQSGQYVAIATGPGHSLAIRKDGTLAAWGYNSDGQTTVPLGKYKAIAGGTYHSLAIRDDGTLAAWGHNGWGQCNVPSGTFKAVAAGAFNSLAIRTDGTLEAWGHNGYGQTNVPAGTYTSVVARQAHCLAIRSDGALVGWGLNPNNLRSFPAGSYMAVSTGPNHSLAIRSDGTLIARGLNDNGECNVPSGTFLAVAAGHEHSLAIRSDGTLEAWGNLGGGLSNLPTGRFSSIAAGNLHSLALEALRWTFASLHPAGAWYSAAWAAGDGQIGGVANHGNYGNAALWTGLNVASYVDLSGDLDGSDVWDVAGGVQVGSFSNIVDTNAASLWKGSPATFLMFPQADYTYGIAAGTDGNITVGQTHSGATLWSGTSSPAMTVLHPPSAASSFAWGVANGVQVGDVGIAGQGHASVWYGTAASWVDIHPAGASASMATRTDGAQHVGWVLNHLGLRAALWTSNSQWTDLTPLGYDGANAYNLGFGHQVGHAYQNGMPRAIIWSGSAGHYEDLHDYLPIEYAAGGSYAWDLDVRDGMLVVVGEAFNTVTGQTEAVIWIADAPNQAPVAVLPAGGTVTLNPGETTTTLVLDGSGSTDPDNDALTYSWTSDPAELLQGVTGPVQTLEVGVGTFTFTLTVSDPEGASDSATATYTVVPGNRPPVANAGPDQTVTVPHDGSLWTNISPVLTLSGVASSDPDGDPLTCLWSLGTVTWQSSTFQTTLPVGTHTFLLRVTDPSGLWSEDEVVVTVLPEPNQPPVADAGPDVVMYMPRGETQLYFARTGIGNDPDGDPLVASWNGFITQNWTIGGYWPVGVYTRTFTVRDPYGATSSDSFVFDLRPALPPNADGPRAVQDVYQAVAGETVTIDPLSNDWHTLGLPIKLHQVYGPPDTQVLTDGRVSFTRSLAGMVHWKYIIVDDEGRTDVGIVRINFKKK